MKITNLRFIRLAGTDPVPAEKTVTEITGQELDGLLIAFDAEAETPHEQLMLGLRKAEDAGISLTLRNISTRRVFEMPMPIVMNVSDTFCKILAPIEEEITSASDYEAEISIAGAAFGRVKLRVFG